VFSLFCNNSFYVFFRQYQVGIIDWHHGEQ
jgi:hypothetical protein